MDGKALRVSAYRVTATVLDETVKPPNPVGKPMTPETMTLRSEPDGTLRIQMPETSLTRDELLFIMVTR